PHSSLALRNRLHTTIFPHRTPSRSWVPPPPPTARSPPRTGSYPFSGAPTPKNSQGVHILQRDPRHEAPARQTSPVPTSHPGRPHPRTGDRDRIAPRRE